MSETPRSGWAVASAGADTVALDLELTHELRLLGLVRDIVRMVQEARKNAGLEVTDRIELWWRVGGRPGAGRGDPRARRRSWPPRCWPRRCTKARPRRRAGEAGLHEVEDEELGLHIWFRRA